MGVVIRGLIMVTIAICLMSVAANAAQGTSSYYTSPYVPSTCYGNKDSGVMIAKVSDVLWNNQAGCGKKYRVRCIGATYGGRMQRPCRGGSVVIKVVDYCPPPGCPGTIGLSKEAFSSIADPNAGKIKIEYIPV